MNQEFKQKIQEAFGLALAAHFKNPPVVPSNTELDTDFNKKETSIFTSTSAVFISWNFATNTTPAKMKTTLLGRKTMCPELTNFLGLKK